MTRSEILIKAVETLNKARGLNFILKDVEEDPINGGVYCKCTWPNGKVMELSFISKWFTNDWGNGSYCWYVSPDIINKIPNTATNEEKSIMTLMAWFWLEKDED